MADKKLLSLLKHSGVDAWNRARVSHPDYPNCDLYEEAIWGADLTRADLSGANLCSALLLGVDLKAADLRSADLSGAWLHRADLTGANLTGAGRCAPHGHYAPKCQSQESKSSAGQN
jgi:uncharacterized protein YjbI with pentapeptide repeats